MTAELSLDSDLRQLATAFDSFNEVSRDLESAYSALEAQMSELQRQLSRSNRQRDVEAMRAGLLSAQMDSLLETLPGAVVMLDGADLIRRLNSGAELLLGPDALGRSWTEASESIFARRLSEHGDLITRTGARLSLTRQELPEAAGQLLLLTDVTDRRRVEEVLARDKRLAALGEMVASLAHQIRTPLSSALLYASNAARPELADDRRCELIDKSIGCMQSMEGLISDMLRFTRGNSEAGSSLFTLGDVLGAVETATNPLLETGQTIEFDSSADELPLQGNQAALAGAIQNLVINSLQAAGHHARIQILATATDDADDAEELVLEVRDNGPGIAADRAEEVFKPFHTSRQDGNGLGLTVARSVVRAHHGELTIEDRTGGACFVMRLPLVEPTNLCSLERETA